MFQKWAIKVSERHWSYALLLTFNLQEDPEVYLQPCQTPAIETFCENSYSIAVAFKYFFKRFHCRCLTVT